ncbi:unnamed protein product [Scytosiphon promiscuus]
MVSVPKSFVSDVERTPSSALLPHKVDSRGGENFPREGKYGSNQQQQQQQQQQLVPGKSGAGFSHGQQEPSSGAAKPSGKGPFPLGVVLLLALCMTLNMYSMVNLFPYVGMMVKDLLRMEPTNGVGFYSGYVASSFTFGRLLSGYVWGFVTDRIGRKPVIVTGLLSITLFSLTFGMSTTYTVALVSRFIMGLTNGIMPALRTTISEVCGPEHVVLGMTYISATRAISLVIGTGIGGLLAQPALHYPSVFSASGIFGRLPFLLPNFVGAVMSLLALVLVVCFLPETKDYAKQRRRSSLLSVDTTPQNSPLTSPESESKRPTTRGAGATADPPNYFAHRQQRQTQLLEGADIYRQAEEEEDEEDGGVPRYYQGSADVLTSVSATRVTGTEIIGDDDSSTATTDELSASAEEEDSGLLGPNGLLATPQVKAVLFLGCVTSTVSIGFDEAYPLFAISTPDVGGLGWDPVEIGKVLVATGVMMAAFQLVLFPPLIKMLGIMTWQRLGCGVGIAAFLAVPGASILSWNHSSLVALSVAVNTLANCSLGAIMLALQIGSTTLVPSSMRGKLGGLYNTSESLGRFLGPVGYSIIYAWSVSPSTLDAYGGWVGHGFVFYASAAALGLVGVIAWGTLTVENLIRPEMREDGAADVGGDGRAGFSSKSVVALSSSPARSYSKLQQQEGEEEGEERDAQGRGGAGDGCGTESMVDLVV